MSEQVLVSPQEVNPSAPENIQAEKAALGYAGYLPKWQREIPAYETYQNLSISDPKGFAAALDNRKRHNESVRKKIGVAALTGAGLSFPAGLGAIMAGGGSAVLVGGGVGFAALGALGYGGKWLYDKYKERKAKKNFEKASGSKIDWNQFSSSR